MYYTIFVNAFILPCVVYALFCSEWKSCPEYLTIYFFIVRVVVYCLCFFKSHAITVYLTDPSFTDIEHCWFFQRTYHTHYNYFLLN